MKSLAVAILVLAAGQASAQKYGITSKTLANGLDVIVIENHSVPLATIEIACKNGAYTETPDLDGLSHLYEHMFFKANRTIPDQETYMERQREMGMVWNGTTSEERVNYYFTLHKDDLNDGLVFMRDAIRYPLFKQDELERERPVVLGEFDRNEASPFSHWARAVSRLSFAKHYSHLSAIQEPSIIVAHDLSPADTANLDTRVVIGFVTNTDGKHPTRQLWPAHWKSPQWSVWKTSPKR